MYPYITGWFGTIELYPFLIRTGSIIGIITVLVLLLYRIKDKKIILAAMLWAFLILMAGTKISHIIRSITYTEVGSFKEFVDKILIHGSGNHFIGLVLAIALLFPWSFQRVSGIWKRPVTAEEMTAILNSLSFFVVIQHFFNRLACFFRGCCYGINHTGLFSVRYTAGHAFEDGVSYPVFASQLFEAGGMIVLGIILVIMDYKKKRIFPWMLGGFGLIIWSSEWFMDQRGAFLFLNQTVIQYAAIITILTGIVYGIEGEKDNMRRKK